MFTGMPTEKHEIFRAASIGEYIYVGYSGKANKLRTNPRLYCIWNIKTPNSYVYLPTGHAFLGKN
jgi:hypothetical protein